jgi:hypothetical protein
MAHWEGIVTQMKDWNVMSGKILSLPTSGEPGHLLKALSQVSDIIKAVARDSTLPTEEGPVHDQSLRLNLDLAEFYKLESSLRKASRWLIMSLKAGVIDADDIKSLQQYLSTYNALLNPYVEKILPSPVQFTYKGFRIENAEGVPEVSVQKILGGIDYALALFKRRGILEVLLSGIQLVRITAEHDEFHSKAYDKDLLAAGRYHPRHKMIVLNTNTLERNQIGRFMQQWVSEVFIHEFGHYVHMNYLTPEARDFWDSGWQFIDEAQKRVEASVRNISIEERESFFDLIRRSGWDVNKAGRKVKGLDRLKFLYWIYASPPQVGMISSNPTQVRLTKGGQDMFNYFSDPDYNVRVVYNMQSHASEAQILNEIERLGKVYRSHLRLDRIDDMKIPSGLIESFRKSDKSVGEALDALGLPSIYARENVEEDFAETFSAFIINPSVLSDVAKWRMGRALGMSGSGGREVLKSSSVEEVLPFRVLKRFLSGQD